MVLMHQAMILGHLMMYEEAFDIIFHALAGLLRRGGALSAVGPSSACASPASSTRLGSATSSI